MTHSLFHRRGEADRPAGVFIGGCVAVRLGAGVQTKKYK